MKQVKGQPQTSASASIVQTPLNTLEQSSTIPGASFEAERRALLAEAAPYRDQVIDGLESKDSGDEDAWLDELQRRIEARPLVTERSQFADFALGREDVLTSETASDSAS
jgi:hypothetical protein